MDRSTYKAARRAIVTSGIAGCFADLHDLHAQANAEADLEEMSTDADNPILYTPEDGDDEN